MTTSVVTLQQAKDFLNITNTTSDAELPFYTSAATAMWANRGGPVGEPGAPLDEWYDGGRPTIVVRTRPIVTVTLVEESWGSTKYTLTETATGSGGTAFAYTVDKATGTFVRRAAGIAVPFAVGERNVHIQYTPGYATVPEDIQLAVLLLLKHMWTTQRGIGKRPGLGGEEGTMKESFAWPDRVEEILAGYVVPGVA